MIVRVTAADIHHGKREIATECPIALALNRATGKRWAVERNSAYPGPRGRPRPLPQAARDFIAAYDAEQAVEPFSFELAT